MFDGKSIMPERPPKELVATLESLGLATADQVARVARRVGRLAKDLPRFDSVWIDALAQARVLTPYQAAELNAGRGGRLRVGPYLICEKLDYPLFVDGVRAGDVESGEVVRLVVAEAPSPPAPLPKGEGRNNKATPQYHSEPWVDGKTAARWIVQYGRFPPEVVLQIARAMAAELTKLESTGKCHGDIGASSLILTYTGEVDLPWPGLRGELRPEEGYAHADLPPEAFDNIAPERITRGGPPTTASDIFACGCLWWQMLCGRPPLAGGDALAKLRSAEECKIRDVREYAPDTPQVLAAAISACMERDPCHRPESMARLASTLGPPTRDGRDALIRAVNRAGRPVARWNTHVRSVRRSSRTPLWLTGAACVAATVVALLWPEARDQRPEGRGQGTEVREQMAEGGGRKDSVPLATPVPASEKVIPVAHQEPIEPPAVVELWTHRSNKAAEIKLHAGQCVRAPPGSRAEILVPRAGLIVDKENVRFENIDFRWDGTPGGNRRENAEAALVRLTVSEASFRGCRFLKHDKTDTASAVYWTYPPRGKRSTISLPSGRIDLTDCLIDSAGAGIDCRTVGALAIRMTNVLHVAPGPLVRLDHSPRPDESVALALGQTTLRGGPLLECYVMDTERRPGDIAVKAAGCVFSPAFDRPLVLIQSVSSPVLFPGCLQWSGQGSLVAPDVPIIGWRGPDDRERVVLDESILSIAGLVRSKLGFVGAASDDPQSSRIVDWQAPLQSTEPPGMDPRRLPPYTASPR